MTLILRWRQPPPKIELRWRGPTGAMLDALARNPSMPIASVIGPPGRDGTGTGDPAIRFDFVSPLAQWIVNHNLGREVLCDVYSPGGVRLFAEVRRLSNNQQQIDFDTPTSGFALVK